MKKSLAEIVMPKELFNMLGTEEEFERSKRVDEDGDDLLGEKLNQEFKDDMKTEFYDEAMSALMDLGLPEDEAERELEDFNK